MRRRRKMKDQTEILGSPLGMYSLLRGDYIISVLNDDGTLNLDKLGTLVANIANMGANGLRDFFWIDNEDAYAKISPFWREQNGSVRWNDAYFQNQQAIARCCNLANMRYYLSIFDHCGTKKDVGQFNPWRSFENFFYGNDAKDLRHEFIDKILDAFQGYDTGIELCNEPDKGSGDFLGDTFVYLFRKGFSPEKMILGIDYHLKETVRAYSEDYRTMREKIVVELGSSDWRPWIKSRCISPFHNANMDAISDLFGPFPPAGGTRRILYSMDGVRKYSLNGETRKKRPNKEYMKQLAVKVLQAKSVARTKGKVLFEVVYGKDKNEALDSIEGVSEAYRSIFSEYPENKGNFPTPINIEGGGIQPKPFNEKVVEQAYLGILGRPSDEMGEKGYVEFLNNGGSILDLCKKLIDSDEFRQHRAMLSPKELSTGLFLGILNREPDPQGLKHTKTMVERGDIAERAAAMLESEEFKNKFS